MGLCWHQIQKINFLRSGILEWWCSQRNCRVWDSLRVLDLTIGGKIILLEIGLMLNIQKISHYLHLRVIRSWRLWSDATFPLLRQLGNGMSTAGPKMEKLQFMIYILVKKQWPWNPTKLVRQREMYLGTRPIQSSLLLLSMEKSTLGLSGTLQILFPTRKHKLRKMRRRTFYSREFWLHRVSSLMKWIKMRYKHFEL